MSKLTVVKEFPYNPIHSFKDGNPFTIAFVYPKDGRPFCLKGGANDVEKWLEKNMSDRNYLLHETWWRDKRSRSSIKIYLHRKEYQAYIFRDTVHLPLKDWPRETIMKQRGRKISVRKDGKTVFEKHVRRPPRCFPKELHPFC